MYGWDLYAQRRRRRKKVDAKNSSLSCLNLTKKHKKTLEV